MTRHRLTKQVSGEEREKPLASMAEDGPVVRSGSGQREDPADMGGSEPRRDPAATPPHPRKQFASKAEERRYNRAQEDKAQSDSPMASPQPMPGNANSDVNCLADRPMASPVEPSETAEQEYSITEMKRDLMVYDDLYMGIEERRKMSEHLTKKWQLDINAMRTLCANEPPQEITVHHLTDAHKVAETALASDALARMIVGRHPNEQVNHLKAMPDATLIRVRKSLREALTAAHTEIIVRDCIERLKNRTIISFAEKED